MRPAAVIKGLCAAALLTVVVFGAPVALAVPDPACVEACAERWYAEKQACLDALNARYAQIDRDTEVCISNCAPTNYLCQGNCTRNGNIARRAAENDYRKCVNGANTIGWNCYRACEASQARP